MAGCEEVLMAVMDGLTSLRHIREEEKAGQLAHNLVIALSEYRGCTAVERRLKAMLTGSGQRQARPD